ncbi:hypothetical protein LH51_05110 [Nitrincola sp. A-D6]|uniref:hypothetical protein n=1 Tax=Nitrincola sp. A-D6 TaxID=1545442 RepID=UPI00051FE6F4|nr:hypothetical protein [Nitrincola sp. A-D6]KGK42679.1 hypothetical protein LH51_05110 [Nitrincola sp. A-D6]
MFNKATMMTATLLGLAALANGFFMTFAPEAWYWFVPGVPGRGLFNQHFVRDIGINYILIGVAFIAGEMSIKHRLVLWLMPTAWLTGHAIIHVWEVIVGICGTISLFEDFAGVTLPALLALSLVYVSYRDQKNE